uniref:phosphate acyltransferase PlsX n=1 Tax=Ningiella ruwaisensis TaxID=2364274 RepID=UPI00109FD3B9|nr:phosphate acyltransferase PlsX [Ningiella ruwaisensis]
MITIALDIMGGDRGPHVFLPAIKRALHAHPKLQFIVCGDKSALDSISDHINSQHKSRIEFRHCSQVVDMHIKPTLALRKMKDSSMRVALDLVEQGAASACVSCGNTGALMTMAYYVLKTIPGVSRPALVSALPTQAKHKVLLLDLGASVNYDAENLLQYAVMGSVLMQEVEGVQAPRVALLNVGEEEIKGHSLIQHADKLINQCKSVNYIGYVEGDTIFSGDVDVVVTDGFTGNVALKASEGIAKLVVNEIKAITKETWLARLLSKLTLPILKNLYQRMNPDQYNGASLIGLRGTVVKSHGNASSDACFYAIEQAIAEVTQDVPNKIKTKIEHELMEH